MYRVKYDKYRDKQTQEIRYHVNVTDSENNIVVFSSDGQTVKPGDVQFAVMRSKRSRNRYTYLPRSEKDEPIMKHPALYHERGNNPKITQADVARIRAAIKIVTSRPVSFPDDDRDGLTVRTVTI